MLKNLLIIFVLSVLSVVCMVDLASTTTFTTGRYSYYGREASHKKLVIVVTPIPADPGSDTSTATTTEDVAGSLERITLDAAGADVDFTVTLTDSDAITLFSLTDCNSVSLPVSYALVSADTAGTKHKGIPVAGALTFATADVDPNNLTSITATLYYRDD